jgi:GTPase SAR1 family protein
MVMPSQIARIQEAVKRGSKKWGRSKIMLMGEGRAGKTCLGRALLGKSFITDSTSTKAMDAFSVGIALGAASTCGSWDEQEQSDSVLADAIGALALTVPQGDLTAAVSTTSEPNRASRSFWGRMSKPEKNRKQMKLEHKKQVITRLRITEEVEVDIAPTIRKIAGGNLRNSGIEVSLFDFGGQDVFNCLHPYFLTRFGVSIVVFNMTWFEGACPEKSAEALSYLSFWLNSVVINTTDKGKTAPIVLVGTHKDIIFDAEAHRRISKLLSDTFGVSKAWKAVVINVSSQLTFFPVDNTLGARDVTISHLSGTVEALLMQDSQVNAEIPLTWYYALDALNAVQRNNEYSIPFERAFNILLKCGVEARKVEAVLAFFRDTGRLMWYATKELKGVVILDPVGFFVKPVTRVICDPELHWMEAHAVYALQYPAEYEAMRQRGFVSEPLLSALLGYGDNTGSCQMLIALMLNHRLLVVLDPRDIQTPTYVVPALFPVGNSVQKTVDHRDPHLWARGRPVCSFFILFSLRQRTLQRCLREDSLVDKCFLPSGLFDRLLCALLEQSQHNSDIDPVDFTLCKNMAVMEIANVPFRIVWRSSHNCIEVNTTSRSPVTLIRRLETVLTGLIRESIQSLYLGSFVSVTGPSASAALEEGEYCLVPVKLNARSSAAHVSPPMAGEGEVSVDGATCALQHPWLQSSGGTGRYDLFFSHRWGDYDNRLATDLFEHVSDYMSGEFPISTFYDIKHMHHGHRIDHEFFNALTRSEVMVPLVTTNAFQKLYDHDAAQVDNVLVEWLTALVLVTYPTHIPNFINLRVILPICVTDSAGVGYFSLGSNKLSLVEPTASNTAVLNLFKLAGIVLPPHVEGFIKSIKVKQIVDGIMTFYAVCVDETTCWKIVVSECTSRIMKVVFDRPLGSINIDA